MPFRHIKTTQVFKLTFLLFLVFISFYYMFSNSVLITLFNSVFIGILVANFIAYLPLIKRSIIEGKLDRVSQLALAVALLAIELIIAKTNSLAAHAFHLGIAAYSNFWVVISSFLALVAATLLFTAPAMDQYGSLREAPRNWLIAAICAGIGVAAFLIWLG